MKCFALLILVLSQYGLFAQSKSVSLIVGNGHLSSANFFMYDPSLIIKGTYSDTTQALNIYPEQLMNSILSASSQKWIDYNTLGGSKEASKVSSSDLEFKKVMDRDKNYFKLICNSRLLLMALKWP
jgi:hypothetical protein